jgi:hypothetical protein
MIRSASARHCAPADHVLDQAGHVPGPLVEVEVIHDGRDLHVMHAGNQFVERSHQRRRYQLRFGMDRDGIAESGRVKLEHDRLHHTHNYNER